MNHRIDILILAKGLLLIFFALTFIACAEDNTDEETTVTTSAIPAPTASCGGESCL